MPPPPAAPVAPHAAAGAPAKQPKTYRIPCPRGHVLTAKPHMLEQQVVCPECNDLFTLRTAKYGRPSAYWSYQLAQNSVNELAAIDLSDLYYWPSQELTTVPEAQGDGSGRRLFFFTQMPVD